MRLANLAAGVISRDRVHSLHVSVNDGGSIIDILIRSPAKKAREAALGVSLAGPLSDRRPRLAPASIAPVGASNATAPLKSAATMRAS